MPQMHGDRLTAVDASFLAQEGPSSHMHVGALTIFEGPPPTYAELLTHIRSRLHLVPRYRQRLEDPAFGIAGPVWVDDHAFDVHWHLRRATVGSRAELAAKLPLMPPQASWINAVRVPVLMDTSKARDKLKWTPRHDGRAVLRETVDAARARGLV